MPTSRILVSADPYETRVAVLENEQLVEIFILPSGKKTLIGNIYKGRVASVIPGLEAAFVDIGLERNAFLHARDLVSQATSIPLIEDFEENEDNGETAVPAEEGIESSDGRVPERLEIDISELLWEGQELLVQMAKEPLGLKGCRVTSQISLPGRDLVFFPQASHVAISRRIEDEEERKRLEGIGRELTNNDHGVIFRTASAGGARADLETEYRSLQECWNRIKLEGEGLTAPALVYEDAGLVSQVIRDQLAKSTQEVLVEGEEVYRTMRAYAEELLPDLAPRVRVYCEPLPLFRSVGVEAEIERLLQRRAWLKSGGFVVIDETEALTVIDVNTGRDRGGSNLEETALATNLEAIPEIARQLRLRDIGGIIVIDFIDMRSPRNQNLVMERLNNALSADRSHPTLFSMTELGLVQLTRKRVRRSFSKGLSQSCPYCKGEGIVFSKATMVTRILRRFEELLLEDPGDLITLRVHPSLAEEINTNWSSHLKALSARHGAKLRAVAEPGVHFQEIRESFEEAT